jgi:hypothetical protein
MRRLASSSSRWRWRRSRSSTLRSSSDVNDEESLAEAPPPRSARTTLRAATRLGVPFKISGMKPGRFRAEVEKRITAFNEQARLPGGWPVPLPSGQGSCDPSDHRPAGLSSTGSRCARSAGGRWPASVAAKVSSSLSGDCGGDRGSGGCRYWTAPAAHHSGGAGDRPLWSRTPRWLR